MHDALEAVMHSAPRATGSTRAASLLDVSLLLGGRTCAAPPLHGVHPT